MLLQVVASVFLAAYLLLQLSAADTRPHRPDFSARKKKTNN